MESKSILSPFFRVLTACVMAILLAAWFVTIYKIFMTDKLDAESSHMKSLVVTGVPMLLFWFGIPLVFGDYPKWAKRFVPESLQYLFRSEAKKIISDLPWRRNKEVVADLERLREQREK